MSEGSDTENKRFTMRDSKTREGVCGRETTGEEIRREEKEIDGVNYLL